MTLVKEAAVPGGTADVAGETISYTIAVTNDGNVTLTSPVVSDPFVSNLHGLDVNEDTFNDGDADNDGDLDVGETWQYAANHVVTQEEIDAGGTIDNTASVTTDQGATDSDDASVTVGPTPEPEVTLDKVGTFNDDGDGIAEVGETISFVFTVTNTGNVTLTEIFVSDVESGVQVSGTMIASLAPGASDSSFTGIYTITQHDIDFGSFENTASGCIERGERQRH